MRSDCIEPGGKACDSSCKRSKVQGLFGLNSEFQTSETGLKKDKKSKKRFGMKLSGGALPSFCE